MITRLALPCAVVSSIALGALLAPTADASRFGRNGFSGNPEINGGSDCTVCHAPGAAVPLVTISGPDTVDAGTTNTYTVTLSGGPAVTAGVNVSVSGGLGDLAPADTATQLTEGEIAHTEPLPFTGGQAVFTFEWTAPNFDTDATLYAAGNSTTGNLDLAGDGVGTNTLAISVINGFEDPPPPPPPPMPSLIELVSVATGFTAPVAIASAGDERLFVVEQRGKIRLIDANNDVPANDFLDIEDRVKFNNSEEGLLGLAFHPDYAENGYFYVNYIFDPGAGPDRTRVSRFSVSPTDPNIADPASELVLIEFEQDFSNHNGGDLKFGPDGLLYIASGDGGSGGDPNDRAQATNTLMGKLLRIDVDTPPGPGNSPDCTLAAGANYAIPPSNAFNDGVGGSGCDEIYALGLRNPWRISFDRETGDLWVGDVGQNTTEEIDFALAGSGGGLNYGWRCFEGTQEFDLRNCNGSYVAPVFEYSHAAGNCSVTGGFVYRGEDYPALQGQYFFSDFCNSAIRSLAGPVNELVEAEVFPAGEVLFTTFGEDERGELYGADFLSGTIFQIVAAAPEDVPGDVDGDGDVDRADLVRIFRAIGSQAAGPNDPRDVDGDGLITRRDLVLAVRNCTRAGCEVG